MERADLDLWKSREVARLLSLVETERRYYQDIVASLPVGLLILDSELFILSSNRATRDILGLKSAEAVRGRVDSFLPPEIAERAREVLGTMQPRSHLMAGGLRISIQPIRNRYQENALELLLTIEDLRAGREQGLAPARAASRSGEGLHIPPLELLEELGAVVWAAGFDFQFLFVSGRATEMSGRAPAHWLSTPSYFSERIEEIDRERVLALYRQAIEHRSSVTAEFRLKGLEGPVWVYETIRLVMDANGQPRYLLGFTLDATHHRELEQQWAQAQRTEALTKLAARLSHDFNNLLMIVTGYSEELVHSLGPNDPLRNDVKELLTATERMQSLTNELLAFTRRSALPPRQVDIAQLLRNTEEALMAAVGYPIELKIRTGEAPLLALADPGQLEEVLYTFLRLTREAGEHGSPVTITIAPAEITEDLERPEMPLRAGRYVGIRIGDSGSDPGRPGLFESFLPSKEGGTERGPALARAYSLIRQWHGDIALQGAAGIQILLPRVQAERGNAVETVPAAIETAPQSKKNQTILVTDDEAGIRALVRKILKRQGYEVMEAANGEEALKIFREQAGKIDLLITDIMMPGMSGRELASRVLDQRAAMKVLYISGYTNDEAVYAGDLPPGTSFLQKPFTLVALIDKVREVLEAK